MEGNNTIKRLRLDHGVVSNQPQDVEEFSMKVNGSDRERNDFGTLDADLLGEVLFYLLQHDRLEVMCVNKHWEKAVTEGRLLWKRVEVARMWDTWSIEGRKKGKHAKMYRLVGAAEEVKFLGLGYTLNNQYKLILRVVETSLKVLELPHASVDANVLSRLLAKCVHLEWLLVKGDVLGKCVVHICHPKLEKLEIQTRRSGNRFSVQCPHLTHMSTVLDREQGFRGMIGYGVAPIIDCPRLTHLHLSFLHCAIGIFESVLRHCPNVKVLSIPHRSKSDLCIESIQIP